MAGLPCLPSPTDTRQASEPLPRKSRSRTVSAGREVWPWRSSSLPRPLRLVRKKPIARFRAASSRFFRWRRPIFQILATGQKWDAQPTHSFCTNASSSSASARDSMIEMRDGQTEISCGARRCRQISTPWNRTPDAATSACSPILTRNTSPLSSGPEAPGGRNASVSS